MRFIAWDPDDGGREIAKPVEAFSAESAARRTASAAYKRKSFEKRIDINVITIYMDGSEMLHELTVYVDLDPTFTARSRR